MPWFALVGVLGVAGSLSVALPHALYAFTNTMFIMEHGVVNDNAADAEGIRQKFCMVLVLTVSVVAVAMGLSLAITGSIPATEVKQSTANRASDVKQGIYIGWGIAATCLIALDLLLVGWSIILFCASVLWFAVLYDLSKSMLEIVSTYQHIHARLKEGLAEVGLPQDLVKLRLEVDLHAAWNAFMTEKSVDMLHHTYESGISSLSSRFNIPDILPIQSDNIVFCPSFGCLDMSGFKLLNLNVQNSSCMCDIAVIHAWAKHADAALTQLTAVVWTTLTMALCIAFLATQASSSATYLRVSRMAVHHGAFDKFALGRGQWPGTTSTPS